MRIQQGSVAALLLLAACGPVNQGLDTVHQPVVDHNLAYVPGCPDWSYGGGREDLNEATSANYGCANMTNLAAMVADPRDLLVGKSSPDNGHDPFQIERSWDRWSTVAWKPFGFEQAYGGGTTSKAPAAGGGDAK